MMCIVCVYKFIQHRMLKMVRKHLSRKYVVQEEDLLERIAESSDKGNPYCISVLFIMNTMIILCHIIYSFTHTHTHTHTYTHSHPNVHSPNLTPHPPTNPPSPPNREKTTLTTHDKYRKVKVLVCLSVFFSFFAFFVCC